MNTKSIQKIAAITLSLTLLAGLALAAQDKYTVKVPGGLAFSEFKGYEGWQVVNTSTGNGAIAIILANPVAIDAYRAGIPGNGKPFPDGSKLAKIHWLPKQSATAPTPTTVTSTLLNAHFMEKDSKRFADSGGWGWAAFEYEASSDSFRPRTAKEQPPQANDAKCGLGCHTLVQKRDYVFTEYANR
jgi:hypothetical protein